MFSADTGSSRFTHVVQKTWFETHTTKRERKKKREKKIDQCGSMILWQRDAWRRLASEGVRGRQRASEGVGAEN